MSYVCVSYFRLRSDSSITLLNAKVWLPRMTGVLHFPEYRVALISAGPFVISLFLLKLI